MSVYNGQKYLRQAIESILNQTFKDFEFIIINDDSTDSSLEIIQSCTDPRIKLINNQTNLGLTKSLNIGIKQAQGKYIARLDADDISLTNRLAEQYEYLKKHPDITIIGSDVELIDENNKTICQRQLIHNPDQIKFGLIFYNQLMHSSIFFKKSAVEQIGGYNENFKYTQDYELYSRLSKKYKISNLNQILIKHRTHSQSISQSKKTQQIQENNTKNICFKNINDYVNIKPDDFDTFYQSLWKKTSTINKLRKSLIIHKKIYQAYLEKEKSTKDQQKTTAELYRYIQRNKIIMGYVKNRCPMLYDLIDSIYQRIKN